MKKYSARYLSNKEKEHIVECIGRGEKISRIAKEIGVSRTTLYKWMRVTSFEARGLSHKINRRRISLAKRRKVIELTLKYPYYSIRQISSLSGISIGFVWSLMNKHSLSTKEQRRLHFLTKGTSLYKNIRDTDKVIMVGRYRAGEQATRICKEYGVSRTIFYRWLHKCNKARDRYVIFAKGRPRGRAHWRFIAGVEGIVRDLVASNPELSLSRLHNQIKLKHEKIISRSGLYYVCKRLELTTYEKRLIYAKSGGGMAILQPELSGYIGGRYLRENIFLFIQLALLSVSSLVFSFWVLVLGQRIIQHEPISKIEVNRIVPDKRVYQVRQESEEIIYIVKAGDSLWHISEEIYESGYNWVDIASINRLPDPDIIDIGQRLVIPAVTAREITLAVKE